MTHAALSLALTLIFSASAWSSPENAWHHLTQASAHARVGNAKASLKELETHGLGKHGDADIRLAAQLIRARALLENNEPQKALIALGNLISTRDPAIAPVVGLIQLRAAVALDDSTGILRGAKQILDARDVPKSLQIEARAERAYVSSKSHSDRQRTEAIIELRKLSKMRAARTIRPNILEELSKIVPVAKQRAYVVQLLVHHGGSAPGRRAMKRLSPSKLSEKQKWRRVNQLMIVWSNDLADEDLKSLQKSGSPRARQEALLLRAKIRMRMRVEYPEALQFLVKACKGPDKELADEAWYRRGLVLGNLKRWKEAVSTMRKLVRRKPVKKLLKRAAYQVGRLQHQAGDFLKAGREIKHFVDKIAKGEDTWQWFVGWAYYRAGRYAQARTEWRGLISSRNLLVGPKVLYWTARTFLHQGAREKAKKNLETLSRKAPLGYYGLLGAALYSREFANGVSPWPPRAERFPVAQSRAIDLLASLQGRKNRALRAHVRAIQLRSAVGFPDMAREVTDANALETRIVRQLGSQHTGKVRDALTFWLELWGKRWRKEARKRMAWASGLHHFGLELVEISLPPAYLQTARAAGALHDVSAWWLIAHMLQESRYKESAISHAGALGPMQILPITGKHIARRAGFPRGDFSTGRLFEPGVALRQAAWYLAALRNEFGGNTLMAIAAYNGGPRRISEYLQGDNSSLPMDEFIEEIGAHETRNYVRKVTDHLVRYLTIYGSEEERTELLQALLPPAHVPEPEGKVRF